MTPGDIVWLPFPHVEDNRMQSRPALIVAVGLAGALDLCWALMITAAANPAWPEDVIVDNDPSTGLPKPSRVRIGKTATVAAASATPIGRLPESVWCDVRERIAATLGFAAS